MSRRSNGSPDAGAAVHGSRTVRGRRGRVPADPPSRGFADVKDRIDDDVPLRHSRIGDSFEQQPDRFPPEPGRKGRRRRQRRWLHGRLLDVVEAGHRYATSGFDTAVPKCTNDTERDDVAVRHDGIW
jgi:hypothetical protein